MNDFDQIVNISQYLLNNLEDAQFVKNYLNDRLTKESQNKFQFGYFPNSNNLNYLTDQLDIQILIDQKLLYPFFIEDMQSKRTIYSNHFEDYPLILPFKNTYGKIVALVGRTLISEKNRTIAKYKNTQFEKGKYLFGLYENKTSILEKDCVYIVEGQFDVIKAVEKGFTNIVALGNANMTMYQFSVINRYTNNIFLLLDNDEAGNKGRRNIISKFRQFANIRNFYLPEPYKDIDEFLTEHDYDDLELIVLD